MYNILVLFQTVAIFHCNFQYFLMSNLRKEGFGIFRARFFDFLQKIGKCALWSDIFLNKIVINNLKN